MLCPQGKPISQPLPEDFTFASIMEITLTVIKDLSPLNKDISRCLPTPEVNNPSTFPCAVPQRRTAELMPFLLHYKPFTLSVFVLCWRKHFKVHLPDGRVIGYWNSWKDNTVRWKKKTTKKLFWKWKAFKLHIMLKLALKVPVQKWSISTKMLRLAASRFYCEE